MKCPIHESTHKVDSIHFRGKEDSLELRCSCGEETIWAEWYGTRFPGWSLSKGMVLAFLKLLAAQPRAGE